VQRQVADDNLVGGGSVQLTRQAIVIEPHTRVRLPRVFVDRGKLAMRISRLNTRVLGGFDVGE
jgi:hypothetical protein